MTPERILVFPSRLGWMAIAAEAAAVARLTFGHPTPSAAEAAATAGRQTNEMSVTYSTRSFASPAGHRCCNKTWREESFGKPRFATCDRWLLMLVYRLQKYSSGAPDDFRDIRISWGPMTQFQRRVLEQCRRIAYGSTTSYGGLAIKAGYPPGTARAVGNCMAANRIPLIVPCHRVVCADGRSGAYSAPGGIAMKRRLLALET
jgi:O-6-methylguanine DNA methyltransferase